MKPSDDFGLEVLVAFVNDIYNGTGWWCNIGMSNEDSDEECDCLLPSLSKIFGIYKSTMRVLSLKINYLKGRERASF